MLCSVELSMKKFITLGPVTKMHAKIVGLIAACNCKNLES